MRVLFSLFMLSVVNLIQAQQLNKDIVSDRLLTAIKSYPEEFHRVYIMFEDQVDLLTMDRNFYQRAATLQERSFEVITSLKQKAQGSQAKIIEELKVNQFVEPNTIQSFWITNLIFLSAKIDAIAMLSNRRDIAWIDLNGSLEQSSYKKMESVSAAPRPNGIESGLLAINAPAMWAMGYTGYGQVVFTNDTGIDPTHPSIRLKYKANYVSPKQSWYQYRSSDTNPNYCNGHGTHTLGTMLGLDRTTNDTIGVAYNALWIGSSILCGGGTESNIGSFQWAMDPDNNPASISDMPDVINNSWFDPNIQNDCHNVYNHVLDALEAVGIAVVFSAGNEGPDPSTITAPHNINTDEVNSFTVAAVNGNDSRWPIADFSSRGPTQCDGEGSLLIKPEVAAPGVNVRSCVPDNAYDFFQGTSMAAPHVAGAILLLKEAFPELTGREFKLALYHTCRDLGTSGEDNDYGMGMIDVLAAFDYLIAKGNVPEDPTVDVDIMLVDLILNEIECDKSISPVILFENAGTETINSFDVTYQVKAFAGAENTFTWTGELKPRERKRLTLPSLELIPGDFKLSLELKNPNNRKDQRLFNNTITRSTSVIKKASLSALGLGVDSINYCQNARAVLHSNYDGDGVMHWYDAEHGGDLVGEGTTIQTPILEETTSFFAELIETKKVGRVDLKDGEAKIDELENGGLIFNTFGTILIKSLRVFAEKKGARLVVLRDANGEKVTERFLLVKELGDQRVDLNLEVPPGNNWRLVLENGKPLSYTTKDTRFPYKIADIMEIRSSIHPLFDKRHYHYFYDWEVEYKEICGRKEVIVNVESSDALLIADFNSDFLIDNEDTTSLVEFSDLSTGAVEWFWDFGDGSTSSLQHPEHEYGTSGKYIVTLTIISEDACSAAKSVEIVIGEIPLSSKDQLELSNAISIFPNPTKGNLNISFSFKDQKEVSCQLLDVVGRSLKKYEFGKFKQSTQNLNLEKNPEGVYFILFEIDGIRLLKKIVVLK